MGKGSLRNKPCWCNSGLKHKACNFNREEMAPPTLQDKLQNTRRIFGKKYCIHPNAGAECKGDIIKAHTVQRSGGLTRIARQGHVYTLDPGDAEFVKTGRLSPRLIGVNSASTFTGFCNYHDTKTFAPIENHPFEGHEQQVFLLGYRALCRELFMKRSMVEHLASVRHFDAGADIAKQIWWQDFVSTIERGEKSSLRHLEQYKLSSYDRCLINDNYSDVHYYVVRIGITPDFLCSGTVFPDYDFYGHRLQTLTDLDEVPQLITFSIIATDNGGAAIFSWVGPTQAGQDLIKSFDSLTNDEICHAIARFSFEYVENIFISPDWWENLSDQVQHKLVIRLMTEMRPDIKRVSSCLKDDGVRITARTVVGRSTNISLQG